LREFYQWQHSLTSSASSGLMLPLAGLADNSALSIWLLKCCKSRVLNSSMRILRANIGIIKYHVAQSTIHLELFAI
jgi:hypothetical protein